MFTIKKPKFTYDKAFGMEVKCLVIFGVFGYGLVQSYSGKHLAKYY